jgi:hypothetical protein
MPLPGRARANRAAPGKGSPYGYFDGVVGGIATGWCWRPSDPTERLEVEVVVDGRAIASGIANGRRDNVKAAGYGDGRYGYRVRLPDELDDGGSHRIAVRAAGAMLPPASVFLPGGPAPDAATASDGDQPEPWVMTTFAPDSPAGDGEKRSTRRRARRREKDAREPLSEVSGYVDGISGRDLIGWVVDPAEPETSLTVEARFDGQPLGELVADLSRSDVERAGYGDAHGFSFELPEPPKPGSHTIDVRTSVGSLRVPVAEDYVVLDDHGRSVKGVVLRTAAAPAPPRMRAVPSEALIGLDGWLFEWPAAGDFHVLRGANPLAPEALEWHQATIVERHQLATTAGAAFVGAIVPAKLALYPEQLPAGLAVDMSARPADLVRAALRERNGVDVLDLEPAMRHAKSHGLVFTRTGRGITWLGAFAAYRAIAKELAKSRQEIAPALRDELTLGDLEPVAEPLSELARVVWIGSGPVAAGTGAHYEDQEGEPRQGGGGAGWEYAVIGAELAAIAGPAAAMMSRREPAGAGTALVIHDGSAQRIAPFLAAHFDRTVLVGEGADIDALLSELTPGVMIEIIAESTLLRV